MSADEEKAIEFIQEIIDFLGDDNYQLYTTDRNILITVLYLIKKQQEEIEFYKSIIQTEKKKYKNTKKSLKGQLQNKDKIINEMAKYLIGLVFTDKNQSEFMFNNKQDIINYFTKKVEE